MIKRLFLTLVVLLNVIGCASDGIHIASEVSAQSLYDKGQKYYQAGKFHDAAEFFHQFLASNPDEPLKSISLYYLGHCYQMMGDIKEAKSIYNRVITMGTGDQFWIGVARRRLEELE